LFYLAHLGKFTDNISLRPRSIPSQSFAIHHSSAFQPFMFKGI